MTDNESVGSSALAGIRDINFAYVYLAILLDNERKEHARTRMELYKTTEDLDRALEAASRTARYAWELYRLTEKLEALKADVERALRIADSYRHEVGSAVICDKLNNILGK